MYGSSTRITELNHSERERDQMKSKTLLIMAAMVTIAVLAVTTAIVAASVAPVTQATEPETSASVNDVEPARLTPGTGFPGVYAARDWRKIDPSVYPVVGGHETFTWKELEPTEGNYNWNRIDGFIINQTELGKKTALGITTYNGRIEDGLQTPDWFKNNNPGGVITCGDIQIPRYWSPVYKTKYGNFVTALANHLNNNANLAYVQIGVGLYGETQPSDNSDDVCIKTAMDLDLGSTNDTERTAKWIEAVNSVTDQYVTAFAGRQRLFLVYTPTFINVCEKSEETQYAASKGVGLFAGGFYADTVTVLSNPPGSGCQKWDPIVKWNSSLTATIPVALESYHYMLPDSTQFYWGVLGALNKHADYLSLESDLFFSGGNPANPIAANLDVMRMANQYLGKTTATAPNAWVALRDSSPATNGHGCNRSYFYPQYGDYDYWLYRDDSVAGGRTITVSNISTYTIADVACGTVGSVVANAQYDSKLAGAGAPGMITRRTDTASGNDYMYFRVDDGFLTGQSITSAVFITVTYLDSGSDNWVLYYKNAAGLEKTAGIVTKANSGQWKTTTFAVSDIDFSGKYTNMNDFRIFNGGIGDEYIHMVSVAKYRPPAPTPTVTATSTATATATPTPITVMFQQGISPSPAYTGVADTFISNYGSDQNANYGTNPSLFLRNNDQRAGLIKFDVSSIPGYAIIESASLSFYVDSQSNANSLPVELHKVRRTWVDTQATWFNATTANTWGLPGANDSATDIFATIATSTTLTDVNYWQDFDVTALVQGWVQAAASNNGVALKAGSAGNVEYHLRSSDYNTPAEFRPRLTINYRLPGGPTPTVTITSTPTRTPTRTLTPTPTPVTVVLQKGVSPSPAYTNVQDTFISNYDDATANYGISPTIELRSNDVRAGLLRFDVSSLPAASNILKASVSVHVDYKTNASSLPVSLYRVMRSWGEMEATWLNASNGVTWGVAGANAGSDRSTTATDSVVMSSADAWYDFDVTNLARQWISNPADNKGVVLKAGAGSIVAYGLRSSEYFSAPTYRPKLTIQCYNCQPQGTYRLMLPVVISQFTSVP